MVHFISLWDRAPQARLDIVNLALAQLILSGVVAQIAQDAGQGVPEKGDILVDMVVVRAHLHRHSVSLQAHPVDTGVIRVVPLAAVFSPWGALMSWVAPFLILPM